MGFISLAQTRSTQDIDTINNNFAVIAQAINGGLTTVNLTQGSVNLATIAQAGGTLGTSLLTAAGVDLGTIAAATSATSWTPSYAGSVSMTYTSVSTTYAKYFKLGKMVFLNLEATGTTGGTANNRLFFTLPFTASAAVGVFAASVDDSGVKGAYGLYNTTSQVGVVKYDASNYSLGSGRVIRVNGYYESAA